MIFFSDSQTLATSNIELAQGRAATLAHIRKQSLDIYNRIHSIEEDIKFVREVRRVYPQFPILRGRLYLAGHNGEVVSDRKL